MVINDLKVGAIVQARTNSTRLPNKIFLKLPYDSNYTVLDQIVSRIKKVKNIDEIIIATSNNVNDDKVDSFCKKNSTTCFRGSEENVLSRFYLAALKYKLDVIIRLTGDNPCIDPDIISSTLSTHIEMKNDFTKTKFYPLGINVEILSFFALEHVYENSTNNFEKEHVTPFILNKPDKFKIFTKEASGKYNEPELRLTLDTEEDYALICLVFDYLYSKNNLFNALDIIDLFEKKPWIKYINKKILQKKSFRTFKEELKEAIAILDLQGLYRISKRIKEKWMK